MRIQTLSVFAVVLLVTWGSVKCRGGQIISEPFLGIRHIQATEILPRPLFVNVVEVDLSAPGLSFQVTPQGPPPRPSSGGIPAETLVQTTRQYVNSSGAQVAVNASFFAAIHSGGWTNNLGLTASNGNAYSPWQSPFDANFDDALNITSGNVASIVKMPASIPTGFETNPSVPLYNTVTGSHRLLQGGTNVAPSPGADALTQLQPRTAVGVTADNKLLMVTIDGRQTGFSEGVTLVELANLMSAYGAVDAINLDGGGSTTMSFNYFGDVDPFGSSRPARLVNSPVGNSNIVSTERTVGTNLGIFAQPNPAYRPAPMANAPTGGISIIDSFDTSEGRFTSGPIDSGSTFGVSSASQIDRVLNESFLGDGSQRIVIQSSDPVSPGLGFRHLSAGGSPGSNVVFSSTGSVGFALKVHGDNFETGDLQVALLLDDGSQLEAGTLLDVIADGQWHLYQWNMDNLMEWNNFAGGNGQIDAAQVSIDGIWFQSATNLDFTVFLDAVAFNNFGDLNALIPEPHSLAIFGFGLFPFAVRALRSRRSRQSRRAE